MSNRKDFRITLLEIVILLSMVGILAALSLPAISVGPVRATMTQSLSNMRQLHLATQQMVLDGVSTADTNIGWFGDTNIGWPGDTGGTFTNWAHQLVPAYLSTNDLCKLLSVSGRMTAKMPTANDNAILLYAASTNLPPNTVFLSTANFTNTPTGGAMNPASPLFHARGFVLFHKGGDGQVYLPKQAGQTNLIGTYAPLCH